MPYKPTGRPPGRPRKNLPSINRPEAPPVETPPAMPDEPAADPVEQPAPLTRAREGFRRAFANPADGLHHPPRFTSRREREVGKRPILHPNVITKV